MIAVWLLVMVLEISALQAGSITQHTEGWCSPAVGETQGNVIITCQGVDPRALQRLNELLDKKDLELQVKIREAEDWTHNYQELSQRLAEAGKDNELARQAEALLREGKFEETGVLFDQLLSSDEAVVDRVAANHCNRALVFSLQFEPLQALPHYEKAYRYRPDNLGYANAYARALHRQNRHAEAEPIYQATLKALHEVVDANSATHWLNVATTLNSLAMLYHQTQRLKEAEKAYQEALVIDRQLAETNPAVYQPEVATTLNNLAVLYSKTQRLKEAEEAYQEALTLRRQLAETNPAAYLPGIALIWGNLAVLYSQPQYLEEAEDAYRKAEHAHKEALTIYRELAQTNPAAYRPEVATTLSNLATFYSKTQRPKEAEEAYQKALTIRRQLAKTNPAAYLPNVATTLNNLVVFQKSFAP